MSYTPGWQPNEYGFVDEPDQDQDTVEDRWGRLLDLIIDYGAERFYVGYQYSQQRSTVKTMASGQPDSGTLLLLVRELEKLRREAGDD